MRINNHKEKKTLSKMNESVHRNNHNEKKTLTTMNESIHKNKQS